MLSNCNYLWVDGGAVVRGFFLGLLEDVSFMWDLLLGLFEAVLVLLAGSGTENWKGTKFYIFVKITGVLFLTDSWPLNVRCIACAYSHLTLLSQLTAFAPPTQYLDLWQVAVFTNQKNWESCCGCYMYFLVQTLLLEN